MKDVQNKYIVDHAFLNNGEATRNEYGKDNALVDSQVVRVDYEDNIGFILNYTSDEITVTLEDVNGGTSFTIPSFGYAKYQNGQLVATAQND